MTLAAMVDGIDSKAALREFVEALADDFAAHPETWENITVHQYLLALSSWLADSDGYYRNRGLPIPQTPSWKNVADMLMAAKMHE
jgi:hypothetical protein